MSAEARYQEALGRHGIRDVQPLYRTLLKRLHAADPEAYRRAVSHYEERVTPALEQGEEDPVRVWIDYGAWLTGRLRPGRVVAIDASGRAEPVEEELPLGPLLLYLPDETRSPALPLAVPEEPSDPQRSTLELLCE